MRRKIVLIWNTALREKLKMQSLSRASLKNQNPQKDEAETTIFHGIVLDCTSRNRM
jgi:hypothetical protein